jgi:hypothetical protein
MQEWLALEPNRHAWISLEKRRITGLVSTHARWGPAFHEIDRLRYRDDHTADDVCAQLLGYVGAVAPDLGIHKLFLRLDEESRLLTAARHGGFAEYQREHIMLLAPTQAPVPEPASRLRVRPRRPDDDVALFRFYSAVVPADVRRALAMTIAEWEHLHSRAGFGRRAREFLVTEGDVVRGFGRLKREGRTSILEVIVDDGDREALDTLIAHALFRARRQHFLLVAVPGYRLGLAARLEALGAVTVAVHVACVRQLALRAQIPQLVPVVA